MSVHILLTILSSLLSGLLYVETISAIPWEHIYLIMFPEQRKMLLNLGDIIVFLNDVK